MILIYLYCIQFDSNQRFFLGGSGPYFLLSLVLHCIRNHLRSWASPAARGATMGLTLGTAGSYAGATGCGCLSGALLATNALKQRHEDRGTREDVGGMKRGRGNFRKKNVLFLP